MTWSDGYFSGLNYMHGYYKGLNPLWMRFVCLFVGLEPPPLQPWTYLELGFGKGLSLTVHAAANDGDFWGADFNASHVAHALDLREASGSDATIVEESFRQLAERNDLPQFDFIGLHGVWSWVSEDNRRSIVDILSRHLRVGGLVYVSYNCLPGWSSVVAMRELMMLHHQRSSRVEHIQSSIDATVAFTHQVMTAQPGYLDANPSAGRLLERLTSKKMERAYIAHEYLNRDWHIPTFASLASELERAKLSFAASARLVDSINKFRLNPLAQELADGIGDLQLGRP